MTVARQQLGRPERDSAKDACRRRLREARLAQDCGGIEALRVALEAAEEAGLGPDEIAPAAELLLKLERDQAPLTFTDVSRGDIEALQAAASKDEVLAILMRCMGLCLDDGFQVEIAAELHYHFYAFCRQHSFGTEQTSTFLSIMREVHQKAIVEGSLPEVEAQRFFEALLDRHGRQLPPYSVGVFNQVELALIREYVSAHFFRQYRLHLFAHSSRQELALRIVERSVTLPVPKPLPLRIELSFDYADLPELVSQAPADGDTPASGPSSFARRIGGGGVRPRDLCSDVDDDTKHQVGMAIAAALPSEEHIDGLLSKLPGLHTE